MTKRQHTATFDALGRMLTDVGGQSQTTSFTYDNNGNVISITDPLSHIAYRSVDQLNRVTKIKDAELKHLQHHLRQPQPPADRDGPARQCDQPTPMTASGNTTSRFPTPTRSTTTFNYDSAGNLTKADRRPRRRHQLHL